MRLRNLCLSLLLLVAFAPAATISVVTTTPDLADFARIVGGSAVDVTAIVRGPQNPHFIDVKPSYMMKLRSADVFLTVGMHLDLWTGQLVDGSRNTHLRVVDCSRDVTKLEVPSGKLDASQGDVHPLGNPHYWLDPINVRPILGVIVEALAGVSPGQEAVFRRNADAYLAQLEGRMVEWQRRLAPFSGRQVVTYHSSFSYLMKRFGLVVAGHVEPKPGIPPTPSHAAALVQMIREQHIRVIGVEQYFEEGVPRSIATSSGAKVVPLCTSVEGREGVANYMDLIEYNVAALQAALSEGNR